VVEQLPDRDPLPVRNDARQVTLERIAEPKPALGYELKHDCRRERLRHTPDPKPLILAGPAIPCRSHVLTTIVGDENDRALRPVKNELPRDFFDRRRRCPGRLATATRQHQRESHQNRRKDKAKHAIGTATPGPHCHP
jgi:hypothetical protein